MKAHLLSLLAGTALIATVSIAQASEPVALSESQMDQVTAGAFRFERAEGVEYAMGVFRATLVINGEVD